MNSNPDVYINHVDFSSSTHLDGLNSNLDVRIKHDDSNLIHTSLDGTDISHDVSDSTKGDRYLHNIFHDELYEIENHDASEFDSEISNLRIHYDNTICAIGNRNEYSAHNGLWGCYMMIYDSVKSSGTYNYLCRRIPLPQPLNISAWRSYLFSYSDNIICDFLEFGWPIGYTSELYPVSHMRNHPSAVAYPQHVQHYIETEIQYRALLGPFSCLPFETFHVSPLMTRPKKNSSKRRVIMDFSFPRDQSVNDGIPKETYLGQEYHLSYPTVDDFSRLILQKGRGCHMYKVDISRAYRHFRADPQDIHMLGFMWDNSFYVDISIGFGLRTGAMICQRTTNAIKYITNQNNVQIENYIDDLVGAEEPNDALHAFSELRCLLSNLGLKEAVDKVCAPSTKMEFIGITFDSINLTMSIPQEKIDETIELLRAWSQRTQATRNQLQSILGKLNHIAKCVRPARLFVSRMLETLRASPHNGVQRLDINFQKDINWFLNFMTLYNGVSLMHYPPLPTDLPVGVDACLTGVGGWCGSEIYSTQLPAFILDDNNHISHIEMLNLVIAAKLWRHKWSGHHVTLHCDNIACVYTINTGRARDPYLLKCARELWLLSAIHDFTVVASHKPGAENTLADTLSRRHLSPVYESRLDALIAERSLITIDVDASLFKLIESI